MKTHILKLINNERTNVRISSKKGYSICPSNAYDYCPSVSTDMAMCGTFAFDRCTKKDYAGCQEGADDTCTIDTTACVGAGQEDNT